jgi:tetratricopeptide (TPR) repeat protein
MHRIRPFRAVGIIAVAALGTGLFFLSSGAGQDAPQRAIPVRVIIVASAEEAGKILERLKGGADFGVLAREKSVDATAADGGFMGEVNPETLRAELRDALKGLSAGQLSPVVKLPGGFAVVKVLPPNEIADFDAAEQARQYAIHALGNVRPSFDISGLNETEAALANFPKPDDWYQDLRGMCEMRERSRAAAKARAERYLSPEAEAQDKNRRPFDELSALEALGQLHAYQGELDEAIAQWEIGYKKAVADLPQAVSYMDELLGVAYFHKAENENDVYHSPGDRCIFPMLPGFKYAKTADSEKAIQHLLKALQAKPNDLEIKWVLNLAYMTLGTYPASVPKEALLPLSAFQSSEDIGRFKDVAAEAGLNLFSMAGGISVDDFDGDGLFDVITSSMDQCAPMHFFHNKGDGGFEDRTAKAGLSNQLGGLSNVQTDYDNDGCPDILVMRGGWEIPQRLSLLHNNCNGTFTDVTKKSGLAESAISTQAAAWADINNDGLLDLFVGSEQGASKLFLNRGDGTFKDISHSAGIDKVGWMKAVAAADFDGDGWVDFYVNNYRGDSELFHNNHDGTFTDIARQAGVLGTGHGFGAFAFDYDNDGWPDLFVTSYYMSTEETMRTYMGVPHEAATLKLYKNLGNGAFRDVTEQTGLAKVFMPMGLNFGDVDNDGYLDIYLGNGDPTFTSVVPHVLLRNQEGKSFVDITASSGTGELHKGHGVSFADIGNKGSVDILTIIGGAVRADSHQIRLFENPGNGNDWLRVHLVGVKTNRAAIGARIKVTVSNQGRAPRSIYRWVGTGASFGGSPLEQHIGLGPSARIESLEIKWPGPAGTTQKFLDVGKDQVIEIKEFAQDYTKLVRPRFRLGGAKRDAASALK